MKQGIYGFSADPITLGHLNLIKRASFLTEKLWVVIFSNPEKQYLFSEDERLSLVKKSLKHFDKITIETSDELLVDFAYKKGIAIQFRGIRNPNDLDYEQKLLKANESQWKNLETIYLLADEKYSQITSSMAKAIAIDNGNIKDYVPLVVSKALQQKLKQQFLIAVTGTIASGKSFICKQMINLLKKESIESHEIDMDLEVKNIYQATQKGEYPSITQKIKEYFGKQVIDSSSKGIDLSSLRKTVFETNQSKEALCFLQKTLRQALMTRLRKALKNKKGLIFINAAMIGEYKLLHITHNQVLLITIDEQQQLKRLEKRDHLKQSVAKKRILLSGNNQEKKEAIQNILKQDLFGHLWVYDNTSKFNEEKNKSLINEITSFFSIKK